MYLATFVLLCQYLAAAGTLRASRPYAVTVCLLYALLLIPRYTTVRPHILTYLLMTAMLYLIEFRPRWVVTLPVLGILWNNLHGISYPVLLLICGAYWTEQMLRGLAARQAVRSDRERRVSWLLAVTMLTILVTPHGLRLLGTPFIPLSYATQRIGDVKPLTWGTLSPFEFVHMAPTHWTLLTWFLLLSCAAALRRLASRRIRVSH